MDAIRHIETRLTGKQYDEHNRYMRGVVQQMARENRERRAKIVRGEIPHPLDQFPEMRAAAQRHQNKSAMRHGNGSQETLLDEHRFEEGG